MEDDPAPGGPGVPVYSRRDLIDNREWDLGADDLSELAGLLLRRELRGEGADSSPPAWARASSAGEKGWR